MFSDRFHLVSNPNKSFLHDTEEPASVISTKSLQIQNPTALKARVAILIINHVTIQPL